MKSYLTKLLAILMTVTIIFSLSACSGGKNKETTVAESATAVETTVEGGVTTAGGTTITTGETTTAAGGTTTTAAETTKASGETTTAAPTNSLPTTNAEILAAYTAVLNKAKTDKPGYKKSYYQDFPVSERNVGGAAKYLLPIANLFMTSEEKATANPNIYAKGNDMSQFPILNAGKGCMLTNLNAIKSAKCEKLSNGNYKITIVLKDEINPEPYRAGEVKAPSNTGNMFITIAKSDVDYQMANNKAVRLVIKSGTYTLKYYDCTATLEYNPKTNHVVSLEQVTNGFVTVSGEIFILGHSGGTAVLVDTLKIFDLQY